MKLSQKEYWSGCPFPAPGDLPEDYRYRDYIDIETYRYRYRDCGSLIDPGI